MHYNDNTKYKALSTGGCMVKLQPFEVDVCFIIGKMTAADRLWASRIGSIIEESPITNPPWAEVCAENPEQFAMLEFKFGDRIVFRHKRCSMPQPQAYIKVSVIKYQKGCYYDI